MECPCYGCEKRNEICHGNCKEYIKWHKQKTKQKEQERKKRNAERQNRRRYWSRDGYHY